jgi:hypothetical protein
MGFTNSDSTLCCDTRRAKAITRICADCRCSINRGLRCGPCRETSRMSGAGKVLIEQKKGHFREPLKRAIIFQVSISSTIPWSSRRVLVCEVVAMSENKPISVIAMRADGYSPDGKAITISLTTKYSAAERKYTVPIECLRDLIVDLQRLSATAPNAADDSNQLRIPVAA